MRAPPCQVCEAQHTSTRHAGDGLCWIPAGENHSLPPHSPHPSFPNRKQVQVSFSLAACTGTCSAARHSHHLCPITCVPSPVSLLPPSAPLAPQCLRICTPSVHVCVCGCTVGLHTQARTSYSGAEGSTVPGLPGSSRYRRMSMDRCLAELLLCTHHAAAYRPCMAITMWMPAGAVCFGLPSAGGDEKGKDKGAGDAAP